MWRRRVFYKFNNNERLRKGNNELFIVVIFMNQINSCIALKICTKLSNVLYSRNTGNYL